MMFLALKIETKTKYYLLVLWSMEYRKVTPDSIHYKISSEVIISFVKYPITMHFKLSPHQLTLIPKVSLITRK